MGVPNGFIATFTVNQAKIIQRWCFARAFHVLLSPTELTTLKRINTYTHNLFRDPNYLFYYSKREQEQLRSIREKWIKFLKSSRA